MGSPALISTSGCPDTLKFVRMNYSEAIRFSLQSLKANPLRTFLTALGLIIGNASVILVVTISLVSKDFILDQIRGIGSNLVYASYEAGGQNNAQVEADFVKLSDLQAIRDASVRKLSPQPGLCREMIESL